MKKIIFSLTALMFLLTGCTVPPGQVKKQTAPGQVKKITGSNPVSEARSNKK